MSNGISKSPTGIKGFDEITEGGLPAGRTALVCGNAGCGKTIMAMQFLLNGIIEYGEHGVFMSFEEPNEELKVNFSGMGYDLDKLESEQKLLLDYVYIERSEIQETGTYDLEGLFIRLEHAIDSIGAKRVVLDTIEALFSGFRSDAVLRAELRRLFRWLKSKNVTVIMTAERSGEMLTRHGLEEYVADCVILLENIKVDRITTRLLQVIKYRGSSHGGNSYPFLIDHDGITVFPITSLVLDHTASSDHISTGIESLDGMFNGNGYFRGSSVLLSGTPGSGKTTVAASTVDAACRRGETCVIFSFEESEREIIRNLRSVGIDLKPWIRENLLHIVSQRPTLQVLEVHLMMIHQTIEKLEPQVVVVDPISSFTDIGNQVQIRSMLMRMLDFLKSKSITSVFTDLLPLNHPQATLRESMISSVADVWIMLRNDIYSEHRRGMYIIKARGMKHSDRFQSLSFDEHGISLENTPITPIMGSIPC